MKQFFLIPTLAVLMLACQQQAVQPVNQKVLGTLKMQLGSQDNPILSILNLAPVLLPQSQMPTSK